MQYIDTPTVSWNIIAEAAVQVNVPMFKMLFAGTWYRGNWFVNAYNHQYSVHHAGSTYQSLHPADFFAINAPIELLDSMSGTNKTLVNDNSASVDDTLNFTCPFGWSAVGFAASAGRLDVVNMLMDIVPGEQITESFHMVVMGRAIASGRVDIVEALFNHERFTISPPGCTRQLPCEKPRAEYNINRFQISYAIIKNHLDMMRWMLEHRARPDIGAESITVEMAELILSRFPEMSISLLPDAIRCNRADLVWWMLSAGQCTNDEIEEACSDLGRDDFAELILGVDV